MYIPSAFRVTDSEQLTQFIQTHSFALLVSSDHDPEKPPVATHLPLLLELQDGRPIRLIGHMAKANPQWRHCHERNVLAIFTGPHAYISAAWYGEKNVVPTWNYVAVHVTGRIKIEQDSSRAMEIVRQTVEFYERGSSPPWSMDSTDAEYQQKMVDAIVAFTIEIEHIDGCWKLNQHHSETRRQGTINGLLNRAHGDDHEIAELMQSGPQGRSLK
jgi:transcriptional regulator